MLKNRHKALTLWARARDYECQRSIDQARQRSEARYQEIRKNDTFRGKMKQMIDSSHSLNLTSSSLVG
jgi:hypothetical protein